MATKNQSKAVQLRQFKGELTKDKGQGARLKNWELGIWVVTHDSRTHHSLFTNYLNFNNNEISTVIRFILNEKEVTTALPPGMVLLDFIRYQQHLVGTKIGCREGDCGACVVLVGELKENHLSYQSMTSCLLPLGNVHGKHIVTIEGINFAEGLNPLQQAMADEGGTQCGFCTPGFVVSLAGLCLSNKNATKENAIAAMDGNICRCTGYKSIERAAERVNDILKEKNGEEPVAFLTRKKILPGYFSSIKPKLQNLENGVLVKHPTSLETRLTTHDSRPDSYRVPTIAGGTDLYVQKHDELVHADSRFVFTDPRLKGIRKEGSTCFIGPSATVTDLLESPLIQEVFPGFSRYARLVSSTPIRNMATIGGNFVNASPIGDFTIFFLALDAQLELAAISPTNGKKTRTLPLRKLYRGYKTLDKEPGEIIERISFELPSKNAFFNFEKVSKRTNLDIASVNTAICLLVRHNIIEHAGLSAGGVAPVPMYLQKTSEYLIGKMVSDELIDEVINVMQSEISPVSDARGSKEYKTLLLGQLIRAHFMHLATNSTNDTNG